MVGLSHPLLVISPNSKTGDELNFQQRWEFTRENRSDSSSNDSKSGGRALPSHKLPSGLVPDENDEINDDSQFQHEGSNDLGPSMQADMGKQRDKRTRNRRMKVDHSKNKEGSRKKNKRNKDYQNAAMNDLENYTNSLVEDLKVARQDLVIWMRKKVQELVREESSPKSKTRQGRSKGKKVQRQNPDILEQTQAQHQNNLATNKKVRHQINSEEYNQVQHLGNFKENAPTQNFASASFVTDVGVQHRMNFQESVQLENWNNFFRSTKAQNCNGKYTETFGKRKRPANPNNCSLSPEDHEDYGLAIVPVTSTQKDGEERFHLPAKSTSKSSSSDQKQKSVVLGLRAPNCSNAVSQRSSRGKKTVVSRSYHPVYNFDYSKALSSNISTEKSQKERSALRFDPNFSAYSTTQMASHSNLTSPPASTNSHAASNRPDSTSFNYFKPIVVGNQTGLFSQLLGSSNDNGFFPAVQLEERTRSFPQAAVKEIGCLNQKIAATSIGRSRFQAQLHQHVDGNGIAIPRKSSFENILNGSNNMPSLTLNGGMIGVPGQSYSFTEQYIGNNFLSYPNHKTDSRLMNHQGGCQFPK